jgi:glycosyltransferase involved in cell wall biosynthesis
MDDLWVVLPHLGAGGAQKVGLLAAEHFASQGLRVRVLSLRHGHPIKHALPAEVDVFDLGPDEAALHPWLSDVANRSLLARSRRFSLAQLIKLQRLLLRIAIALCWPLIERQMHPERSTWTTRLLQRGMPRLAGFRYARLRQLIVEQRPRRILALLTKTNILCCAAAWDLPLHVVVSERNDPHRQLLEPLWSRLRSVYYRRADVVTANTQGVIDALQVMGSWPRLELLPNPLPAGLARVDQQSPVVRERVVLAVARLVPQKGLDVLLQAFAALPMTCRGGWRLILVGDGPERQALEQQAQQLDIAASVSFAGFRSDPLTFMQKAAIFALPSRFEGMPNALLEAMAAGLPSVVSDASPGPLEMVHDGVHGCVVHREDWRAFSEALEKLMLDDGLRERLGAAARRKLRSLDWEIVEPHWRSVLALPPQGS